MKRILLSLQILVFAFYLSAQQVPLRGVVTVQNSRVNTGKTVYVPGVEVKHEKANPTLTDNEGKFALKVIGVPTGKQITLSALPTGKYNGYVVVNERDLNSITLGRTEPVGVFICNKEELEKRKADLVGVNMKKYQEASDRKIAELNQRIKKLEAANDYANELYQKTMDSLSNITNDRSETLKRVKEYAESMVLINLDEAGDTYVKAYQYFERGELDSVTALLKRTLNYEARLKSIRDLQAEASQDLEAARLLEETGEKKSANAAQQQKILMEECLLLARAQSLQFNYREAMKNYEQAIQIDSMNPENVFEYANCLDILKKKKESIAAFERLLTLPDNETWLVSTYLYLGRNYLVRLEFEKSEFYWQKVIDSHGEIDKLNLDHYYDGRWYYANKLIDRLKIWEFEDAVYSYLKTERKRGDELHKILKLKSEIFSQKSEEPLMEDEVQKTMKLLWKGHDFYLDYQYDLAEENYKVALDKFRKLAKWKKDSYYYIRVVWALEYLGDLYYNMEDYVSSEKIYMEAVDIIRKIDGADTYEFSKKLSHIYEKTKRINDNVRMTLNELDKIKSLSFDEYFSDFDENLDKTTYAYLLGDLAWYYLLLNEPAKAEKAILEALNPSIFLKSAKYDEIINIYVAYKLPLSLLYQSKYEEAKELYFEIEENAIFPDGLKTKFLMALDDLEKEGVTHPDVDKIRKILNE